MSSLPAKPGRAGRKLPHRARNPELTRGEILDAARVEFVEKGLDGARVDGIAARAAINKRLIYHYFGNKEGLYTAVLEEAYRQIREGERALDLENQTPEQAMRRLVRFTFEHFRDNPWFISLLNTENLQRARYLRALPVIRELHSPLVGEIRSILEKGAAAGSFRDDVDPVDLYITIAALCYFPLGNIHTLSTIFGVDLLAPEHLSARATHAENVVMGFLRPTA